MEVLQEWAGSIVEWFTANKEAIMSVVSTLNTAGIVALVVSIVRQYVDRKTGKLLLKQLDETLHGQDGANTTVTNIDTKVDGVANVVDEHHDELTKLIMAQFETVNQTLDNFNHRLETVEAKDNMMIDMYSVVYSTIKNEDIREKVQTILVNAKYTDKYRKDALTKEIEHLKTELTDVTSKVQDTVDKVGQMVAKPDEVKPPVVDEPKPNPVTRY